MAIQHEHGTWGEDLAVEYLRKEGYEVVARNWRFRRAEIDVIAKEKEVLVFVEVKARASLNFGRPEQMVGTEKQKLLIEAAMAYMRMTGYEWEIRFDIVAIHGQPGRVEGVELIRDAFFPGLGGI